MSESTLIAALRSNDIFFDLPEEVVGQLVKRGGMVELPADTTVFAEGDPGDALYLILSGRMEVLTNGKRVAIRKKGELVGEMAILDGLPRSATVRTRGACRAFRLGREQFHQLLEKSPRVALELLETLSSRTRESLAREQELVKRLQTANDKLRRFNDRLEKRVRETTRELSAANRQLREMSLRDGLTGVYNRRFFQETIDLWLEVARSRGSRLSLVLFDIDHFKKVNDVHGHQAGDRVLVHVARLAGAALEKGEVLARYGGEEFAVLLRAGRKRAAELAEKLRVAVSSAAPPLRDGKAGQVTISLGVSAYPRDAQAVAELIEKADAALYRSKENGRNLVTLGGSQGGGTP